MQKNVVVLGDVIYSGISCWGSEFQGGVNGSDITISVEAEIEGDHLNQLLSKKGLKLGDIYRVLLERVGSYREIVENEMKNNKMEVSKNG